MDEPLPSLTSLQCIDALRSLGFEIVEANARRVHLVGNGGKRVFVGRHREFSPYELRTILFLAGVEANDFLRAIARRGSHTSLRSDAFEPSTGVQQRDPALGAVAAFLDAVKKK